MLEQIEPDNDSSLYRLFGLSLFVAIKFRKKACFGHLRRHYHILKRRQYNVELKLLTSLLETDKSVLPAIIKFQDRGKMMFPHQAIHEKILSLNQVPS